MLRDAAAIQALATFPIFYDTSFEQRLLVFKNGSGEGYEIPETRGDGTPTCEYGEDGCDEPDYIVYDSDRLHTTYVAVVIQPNREQRHRRTAARLPAAAASCASSQDASASCSAIDDPERRPNATSSKRALDLERDETFVEYLIELERMFGISTYLY